MADLGMKYEYRCDTCPSVLVFVERPSYVHGTCCAQREDGSVCGGALREWAIVIAPEPELHLSVKLCGECARPLDPEWIRCPYHEDSWL